MKQKQIESKAKVTQKTQKPRGAARTYPQETVLPLALAGGAVRKARGLLFSCPNDEALLFMPCGDVHTAGMRHRLDIAFVDASGIVLESYRSVGPFRRLRKKGAVAVVERFSSCSSPWFFTGDRVGVVRVEGERS